jgi:NADPH-dependent 2,4-dienoyl-CoA reductase/sulfur reductase-like enzyme
MYSSVPTRHAALGGNDVITMTPTNYLIIGNGAAGATAAETIRQQDTQGRITIVSAEAYPMYSRPGLAYVATGEIPPHQVIARTPEWYDEQRIARVQGEAVQLDVVAKQVKLADGIFAAGYPKSQVIACDSADDVDGIDETVTVGRSSLTYDAATDRYTYIWKTNKSWAGTCRQLVIGLDDGTFHRANFQFK